MTIKELEALTGRTWVGIFGFCTMAMTSYRSLESALNVLDTKEGHRIVKFSNKFYVAPILSDFDDDSDFSIGITLLEGKRYINAGSCKIPRSTKIQS